jgi:Glycosyl hydrolases family 39
MNQNGEIQMRMCYGVNQADACQAFALGDFSGRIQQNLRDIDSRIIRLFLYDKGAPDPVTQWPIFSSYVQAVLNIGAKPMITFAKMHKPVDDLEAVDEFANRSGDVVRRCIEQWGGDVVRDWYWCVWNEPNNEWISGPVTFGQYRNIYEQIADRCLRWLKPHLQGRRPLIGGPGVEGFQPFWMDWVWRFLNEIDNELIGFLDWHCYGDWREHGENNAPVNGAAHRRLLMGLIDKYQNRARVIGQMLQGRDMLNICGELNCHSHYTEPVRARFNHSIFGATYYIAALLQLMRAQVDVEMFWVGTEEAGGYGMMNEHGDPWPSFYAKKLCAQYIRHGDWISFPSCTSRDLDMVVARSYEQRRSALLVHRNEKVESYAVADLDSSLTDSRILLKIDEATRNQVVQTKFDGRVSMHGYGVAVITNDLPDTDGLPRL